MTAANPAPEATEAIRQIQESAVGLLKERIIELTRGLSVQQAREKLLYEALKRVTRTLITNMPDKAGVAQTIDLLSAIESGTVLIDLYQALGMCATPHEMAHVYVLEITDRMRRHASQISSVQKGG